MLGGAPGKSQGHDVVLDGHTLTYDLGSYEVVEAPRFGQKINIGSLKYADFNPYDSAHAIATLAGGYGLQAYSDHPDGDAAATMFATASDIDTRGQPPGVLASYRTIYTLTGSDGNPVWGGIFGGFEIVVAGTKVWKRNHDIPGGYTDLGITLPATAVQGAVGVFNGKLVIGYGASATATYLATDLSTTGNIVNGAAAQLYVFAFTADHASAYIAGGASATADVNKVAASTDGSTYDTANASTCGTVDNKITSLAPGGGLVIVYVGKDCELGAIVTVGAAAQSQVLIPFDSQLSTNCKPLRWALSAGGDEQRGPLSLIFAREHALWAYQPSNQTTGTASNVSPWALPYLRMTSERGRITALQGSARWLYAAITNSDGDTWIIVRDARTGAWSIPYDLGAHACTMLSIATPVGVATVPMLFFGYGHDVGEIILPLDGDTPDAQCGYQSTGSLWLSDIDLGFPDEDKVAFSVKLTCQNLSVGHRYINVYFAVDGSAYSLLGIADAGEDIDIPFDSDVVCKRLSLRLDFVTDDVMATPELHGLTARLSLNTQLRRLWNFTIQIPPTYHRWGAAIEDSETLIADLWSARAAGTPVAFRDRWGHNYDVRLLALDEKEVHRPGDARPESVMKITLLEFGEGEEPLVSWETGATESGAFLPMVLS